MKIKRFLATMAAILFVFAVFGCEEDKENDPGSKTPKELSITFNGGIEGSTPLVIKISANEALGSARIAQVTALQSRLGYIFENWSLTSGGAAETVNENSKWTSNTEYFANWEAVTYTLTISAVGINAGSAIRNQDDTLNNIVKTLVPSDGSTTAGIPFNITCSTAGHTNCGVTANQAVTTIMIAPDATVGVHAIKVNALIEGKVVASADLSLNVIQTPYGLDLRVPMDVKHWDEDKQIQYTAKAPNGDLSGITYQISSCKSCSGTCGLTFTSAQERFLINRVPETVFVGNHEFTINMIKGGQTVYTSDEINLKIALKFKLTITIPNDKQDAFGNMTVKRLEWVDLRNVYEITVSDPTVVNEDFPEGIKFENLDINAFCLADYNDCELFELRKNPDGSVDTLELYFQIPGTATIGHMHGITMQVYNVKWGPEPDDWQDDDWGEALDSSSLNIVVIE